MNSKVILCKDINLDKSYFNVLDYTEQEMLTLCQNKAIVSVSNFNFVREERNQIQIEAPYASCLSCNYMAFQNPDYSNKWFFAFIDSVEFVSQKNTRIVFTVDNHATWFDYWDPKACLVLREHVASDTVGEHTYPEGLEHGDYICNSYGELGGFTVATSKIIVGVTWLPNNTPNLPTTQYYGGVFSGVYYVAFDATSAYAKNFIRAYDGWGKGDAVVCCFMAPASLCTPATGFQADMVSKINNDDGTTSAHTFHIEGYFIGNYQGTIQMMADTTISSPSTLNGYTPHNNKLFVWPYNVLLITNNAGNNAEYRYEDFVNNTPIFNMQGCLCPGCSIKLYPQNYKKYTSSLPNRHGWSYGLMASKFPICSWQNDAFTNWMTQQAVNVKMEQAYTAMQVGAVVLSGGEYGNTPGLLSQQMNYLDQVYQHALVSPQQRGSLNGADATFAIDEINFSYYKMSIRSEYAQMIDSYFDKYGYKINKIKLPNMVSRTYWNYLQIGTSDDIGYSNSNGSVPAGAMDQINSIYRRGVTIWHDHANIGNYALTNSIAT